MPQINMEGFKGEGLHEQHLKDEKFKNQIRQMKETGFRLKHLSVDVRRRQTHSTLGN